MRSATFTYPATALILKIFHATRDFEERQTSTERQVREVADLAGSYDTAVVEEQELSPKERAVANVGKMDAKKHLQEHVQSLMATNIVQAMATMLDTVVF